MAKAPKTATPETAAESAPASAPQVVPAVGEAKTKAKKNTRIQVAYFDEAGKETDDLGSTRILKIMMAGREETLEFSSLTKEMLFAAAAFGFNTTIRNALNSTEAAGKDGVAAVLNRLSGFRNGIWANRGEGGEGGTPLIIEAMIRAKQDAGQYTDGMEQKWLDQYNGLDKEGKAELTKKWHGFKPVEIALLKIKAERAAAKANAAAGSAGEQGMDF